ncbi:Pentatricopeptide repeat-containing protein At5g50990 [Linum perenne]
MIGGYVKNRRFEEALRLFKLMLSSNVGPDKFTFASLMPACAKLGSLPQAQWLHQLMIDKGIEVNSILVAAMIDMYSKCGGIDAGAGRFHHFKSGDRSHPETAALYNVLGGLIEKAKLVGFVPKRELVMMDVSEEEKEENLRHHSEKLALAYGILKTGPGTEIRISKNLRICDDCHSWFKFVSMTLNRVILVRDRIRFHRFEGGSCSCGEYW